jgi:hypothetical protein
MRRFRTPGILFVVGVLLLTSLGTLLPPAQAQEVLLIVNDTGDEELFDSDNTACEDPCTLYRALQAANNNSGTVRITFQIPVEQLDPGSTNGRRTWTIAVSDPLPPIQSNTIIDGSTQIDANLLGPEIILDGTNATGTGGLQIAGDNVTIKGLGIINFGLSVQTEPIAGISVNGSNNVIQGNFIGVDKFGEVAAPNDGPGIDVQDGENNLIGGNVSGGQAETIRNVIAGNTSDGVLISSQATNTRVQGNYIGVNLPPLQPWQTIPNQGNGVHIVGSFTSGNLIGAAANAALSGEGNIISGNERWGVRISDSPGNEVNGNTIGIDDAFTNSAIPNGTSGVGGGIGIFATGVITGNQVGGPGAAARNVIAGNNGPGIRVDGNRLAETTIVNNVIGLGFNFAPIAGGPQQPYGIYLANGVNSTRIGGAGSERNVIGDIAGSAIFIEGQFEQGVINRDSRNNAIYNNCIGIAPMTTGGVCNTARANSGAGIAIDSNASGTIIGGDDLTLANLIANNTGDGIQFTGTPPISGTVIGGNTITNNGGNGIHFNAAQVENTLIGSETVTTTILSNAGVGVLMQGTTISNTEIAATAIITGNAGDGLRIQGETVENTQIAAQTIDRNGGNGINVSGNLVRDTSMGTDAVAMSVSNNSGDGIILRSDSADPQAAVIGTTIRGIDESFAGLTRIENNLGNGVSITNAMMLSLRFVSTSRNAGDGILFNSEVLTSSILSSTSSENQGDGISMNAGADSTMSLLRLQANGGQGLVVTDTEQVIFNNSLVFSNTLDGLRLFNTSRSDVVSNTIGFNFGNGVIIDSNGSPESRITRVVMNTITDNRADGVRITRTGSGRYVEQVRVTENVISRNALAGIELEPSTGGLPGELSNPNHDINPPVVEPGPLALRLNQAGLLSGYVLTPTVPITPTFPPEPNPDIQPPAACADCVVHVYAPDPELATPDGQGHTLLGQAAVNDVGFFQLELVGVPPLPPQILVTATDGYGNTSEYSQFAAAVGLAIGPSRAVTVAPGDTITFTHRVTNTGTVDITDVALAAESELGWPITNVAIGSPFLEAQQSTAVTVTVQVPEGPADNVLAGVVDELTVTASSAVGGVSAEVLNRSTVSERFVLTVTPLSRSGSSIPSESTDNPTFINYVHTLRNIGNISGTVTLVATTDLGEPWTTLVSPRSVTLGPGQSADVTVQVLVPQGAQGGTIAVTETQISGTDNNTRITLTDTTTVVVDPRAILFGPENSPQAAAGETVPLCYTATNQSNGTQSFQINAGSSLGSQITFRSDTPGVPLLANNIFVVGTGTGNNSFQFCVDVTVAARALPGQEDTITVFLTTPPAQGSEVIGGASVISTIDIALGGVFPRLWLPIIRLNS